MSAKRSDDPLGTPEKLLVPPQPDSHTDERVYELRGTVSKLEQSVLHLEAAVAEQRTGLHGLQRTVWIATGAFLVISALTGFFGNKMWDMLTQVNDLIRRQPPVTNKP